MFKKKKYQLGSIKIKNSILSRDNQKFVERLKGNVTVILYHKIH